MTGGQFQIASIVGVSGTNTYLNGAASVPLNSTQNCTQTLTFGTSSGKMSVEVNQLRGLGAGSSETLNLYDGSLLDVFGFPATFRTIRSFVLFVSSGGDADGVTVKGADSNPNTLFWIGTTPGKTVYPSGPPELGGSPAGVSVTSGASSIKVTNNGAAAVNYVLMVAGSAGVSGSPIGMLLGLTYP
jgi:hypothetical protein